MFVKFTPEDGDAQEWEFDPRKVRQSEGELIQKRLGASWSEFVRGIQIGELRARRVLLWHLMRRTHHTLRYEDTPDFLIGELVIEHSRAEVEELRQAVLKAPLDEEEREQVLIALDMDAAGARPASDGEGKAT